MRANQLEKISSPTSALSRPFTRDQRSCSSILVISVALFPNVEKNQGWKSELDGLRTDRQTVSPCDCRDDSSADRQAKQTRRLGRRARSLSTGRGRCAAPETPFGIACTLRPGAPRRRCRTIFLSAIDQTMNFQACRRSVIASPCVRDRFALRPVVITPPAIARLTRWTVYF